MSSQAVCRCVVCVSGMCTRFTLAATAVDNRSALEGMPFCHLQRMAFLVDSTPNSEEVQAKAPTTRQGSKRESAEPFLQSEKGVEPT